VGCILPSKFLLPDKTAATIKSPSFIASSTSSFIGPEFPMHVVHPYPTVLNPNLFK